MNPIASVISRIETIEAHLNQAIEHSQSHVADAARTGRTVGQVAARTLAGAVPSSEAPTTFADALATVEKSVTEAVERQQQAPTTRPVSMSTDGHECAPTTSRAPQIDTERHIPRTRPVATAPIAPASTTAAASVGAAPRTTQTLSTPGPNAVDRAATTTPSAAPNSAVAATAPPVMRPIAGLSGDPTGAVGDVPFAGDFEAAGARHGVPPRLLSAMAFVESRYLPDVVAERGAVGMMQLMPDTAAELGVDPRNPAASVDGAARLMGSLYDQFGSWDHALAAYHTGAEALTTNGNQPTERGTAYAGRVLDRLSTMTT